MYLFAELKSFDGKHIETLERVALQVSGDDEAIGTLIAVSESEEEKLQNATTWVLKRLLEDGADFSTKQVQQILGLLRRVESWEAKLHLLQMMPKLRIPKRKAASLYKTIAGFLDAEENKFVRAWSYNGLFVIADQFPGFREEVSGLLAKGQMEEAASVKARIRNALKSADWG